jgi:uncharacterized membrane protein YjjP (DUF1212 family)
METRLEPATTDPAPAASARPLQVHFLTRLGHALSVAGDPVSATEQTLRDVAVAYGLSDVEIGVLPTLALVRARTRGAPALDLAGAEVGESLRLDQVAALHDIVDVARRGQLAADEGLARLAAVWATPPRFGAAVRVAGHVILTVGLGLIITPRPGALVLCAGLGLLVGLLTELGRRWASLGVLLPVVAAVLVSVLVFLATRAGYVVAPLLLLVPPLITFLPGGVLTTTMVGLADRHPIAGATRLVAGATQVALLVFGIVVGQTLVGLPAAQAVLCAALVDRRPLATKAPPADRDGQSEALYRRPTRRQRVWGGCRPFRATNPGAEAPGRSSPEALGETGRAGSPDRPVVARRAPQSLERCGRPQVPLGSVVA